MEEPQPRSCQVSAACGPTSPSDYVRPSAVDRSRVLVGLLRRLYSTRRLRSVLQCLSNGREILDNLPAGLCRADLAAEVVESLQRRGQVDDQFFSVLLEHSPEFFAAIAEAAARWDVRISDRPSHRLLGWRRKSRAESGREMRSRMDALRRMRAYWIDDLLETGLQVLPWIDLTIQERPKLVSLPRPEAGAGAETRRSPHQAIRDAYHLAQGNLLLLGEPGSGKTTAILGIARALFDEAEIDDLRSIPVVLNLASWRSDDGTLGSWISKELNVNHCIPCHLSEGWIAAEDIVLLLDGLDEVPVPDRAACVRAINHFRRSFMIPTLVCSRTKPYIAAGVRLALEKAVELQPLSEADVERCLVAADPAGAILRGLASRDPAILELTRSPLTLGIMLRVAGRLQVDTLRCQSLELSRQKIFAVYFNAMIERRQPALYASKDIREWTRCLARGMRRAGISEYRVERMQPSWLPSRGARAAFIAVSISVLSAAALASSSIVDALYASRQSKDRELVAPDNTNTLAYSEDCEAEWDYGDPNACFDPICAEPTAGPPGQTTFAPEAPTVGAIDDPAAGPPGGSDWFSAALIAAVGVVVVVPLPLVQWIRGRLMRIDIHERVAWSWRAWRWLFVRITLGAVLVGAMLALALVAAIPGLACGPVLETITVVSGCAIVAGVLLSPIGGIIPSTSIGAGGRMAWCGRTSLQAMIAGFLAFLPFMALEFVVDSYLDALSSVALRLGSWVAVYVFYLRGGDAIVQHFTLRLILGLQGTLPWRMTDTVSASSPPRSNSQNALDRRACGRVAWPGGRRHPFSQK